MMPVGGGHGGAGAAGGGRDDGGPVAQHDGEAVARFVERFALDMGSVGMPRMPARVFALLLVDDEGRLTASEIAERLQISAASVSSAVRYLEQLSGLVTRQRDPGARRDHYRIDDDLWYQLFTRRDQVLVQWMQTVREGVDVLGTDTPAGLRLAETLEFFEFVHGELVEMNERWHARRAELHAAWGID